MDKLRIEFYRPRNEVEKFIVEKSAVSAVDAAVSRAMYSSGPSGMVSLTDLTYPNRPMSVRVSLANLHSVRWYEVVS